MGGGESLAQKKIIICFALVIAIIYIVIISFSMLAINESKKISEIDHTVIMSSTAPEAVPVNANMVSDNFAADVMVGTYIDSIDKFSIRDSEWHTIFYIWFKWNGDRALDPGGKFQIIDGTINNKELLVERYDDGANFQQYLVSAKLIKFFNVTRMPLEDHMLNICIEDGARNISQLRYVADDYSNISSRVNIPGYKITNMSNSVNNHKYKSTFGDPKAKAGDETVYSQYVCGIRINRSSFGVYIKIFLSLFAGLLLTFASFFIEASIIPMRISLITGAFFGTVANAYVVNSLVPSSGVFGLTDIISSIGILTIFLAIVISLYSDYLYNYKNERAFSKLFDKVMLLVLGFSCIIANIIIPLYSKS